MKLWLRNAAFGILVLVLAGTVLALGRQNRQLKEQNRDLTKDLTEPHRGMLVPAVRATMLDGRPFTLGEPGQQVRQVLYFFTTSCQYCRTSLPLVRSLDSALRQSPQLRASLYAVALDSAARVRRFVDGVRLSVPVVVAEDWRIAAFYRVHSVPQLIVIDSSGRTAYARVGELAGARVLDSILGGVAWHPRMQAAANFARR